MKRALSPLCCLAALVLLIVGILGCDEKSTTVKLNGAGVTAESDLQCDMIVLDKSWVVQAAYISGNPKNPPYLRSITILTQPLPLPTDYLVRWTNIQTKQTYEAESSNPEFIKLAEELVRHHSAQSFQKTLIIYILDSGEVQVWLDARAKPHYKQGFTEKLGSFQGVEITNTQGPNPDEIRQHGAPAPEKGGLPA